MSDHSYYNIFVSGGKYYLNMIISVILCEMLSNTSGKYEIPISVYTVNSCQKYDHPLFLDVVIASYQHIFLLSVTYLKLENLVGRFRKPCVVDIKMGKKTYDPEAGPAKIAKEMTKFPHVEKFGFQFTGMQVYIL